MAIATVLIVGCVFILGSVYISKSTLKELDQVENRILRARHISDDLSVHKVESVDSYRIEHNENKA